MSMVLPCAVIPVYNHERTIAAVLQGVQRHGLPVFLVDDGLATGFTMRAAIGALHEYGARRVVVAVPVGAEESCNEISREVDDLICPFLPAPFHAVGLWYKNFEPTNDQEVQDCLAAALVNRGTAHATASRR